MKGLLIVLLLLWVVGVPLAVLSVVLAYPQYVKSRVRHARRRLARYSRQTGSAMECKPSGAIIACRQHQRLKRARRAIPGHADPDKPPGSLGSGGRRV
jgi:hypothetical protein